MEVGKLLEQNYCIFVSKQNKRKLDSTQTIEYKATVLQSYPHPSLESLLLGAQHNAHDTMAYIRSTIHGRTILFGVHTPSFSGILGY